MDNNTNKTPVGKPSRSVRKRRIKRVLSLIFAIIFLLFGVGIVFVLVYSALSFTGRDTSNILSGGVVASEISIPVNSPPRGFDNYVNVLLNKQSDIGYWEHDLSVYPMYNPLLNAYKGFMGSKEVLNIDFYDGYSADSPYDSFLSGILVPQGINATSGFFVSFTVKIGARFSFDEGASLLPLSGFSPLGFQYYSISSSVSSDLGSFIVYRNRADIDGSILTDVFIASFNTFVDRRPFLVLNCVLNELPPLGYVGYDIHSILNLNAYYVFRPTDSYSGVFSYQSLINQIYNHDLSNYEDILVHQGFENGFTSGYDVGFDDGVTSIDIESVYDEGYNYGYQRGYNAGVSGTLDTSWLLSVISTLNHLLNIEIFPNIRLWYLVALPLVVGMLFFFVKFLKGS